MKIFSAQYILTNAGPPLKRGIVIAEDDGTVICVEDTHGEMKEQNSVEFHNGIIIPGFVNCHGHLELSHMKNVIPHSSGLAEFIRLIRNSRQINTELLASSIVSADNEMETEGIVLSADICNTPYSFEIKKKSRIKYINLLEVFGIDPEKADRRMNEILQVAHSADSLGLPWWFTPHSAYSLSLELFRKLRAVTGSNKVTSIHFMETDEEQIFLRNHSGLIMESYIKSGLFTDKLETVETHAKAVLNEITQSGNLILVHNTSTDEQTIKDVKSRGNIFWCLCPNSNRFIEGKLPHLDMFLEEGCEIVIGTDSLASNSRLSILSELKTLQQNFPSVSLENLILWATLNGARALGEEKQFGTIEAGKKPGLLLLQDVDLQNLKLLPDSSLKRLL